MAPEFIAQDSYTGSHTTCLRKGTRITVWEARELAELSSEGVIFESFVMSTGWKCLGVPAM